MGRDGLVPPPLAVRVEGVETCECVEVWSGVLAGEGVTATVGMGGERGMAAEGPEEEGLREAGATPVGAGFIATPGERERLAACK